MAVFTATGNRKVKVSVNGREVEVESTSPFMDTCQKLARDAGINSFTVLIDGNEIDTDDVPTNFAGLGEVTIIKYDAGARA